MFFDIQSAVVRHPVLVQTACCGAFAQVYACSTMRCPVRLVFRFLFWVDITGERQLDLHGTQERLTIFCFLDAMMNQSSYPGLDAR